MQTMITVQQIRHFAQFGWIEFEHMLTQEECAQVLKIAQEVLAKRLHVATSSIPQCENNALYQNGRDLWRDSTVLKKLFCSQKFSASVSSLTNKQQLLIACDQWIPSGTTFTPLNLEAHLSFQNLVCACLISLEGADLGNVRFLHAERLPLFSNSQLLIAFGTLQTVYVHNALDPCNAALKRLGLEFGDRLTAKLHPLMCPSS
jgi:hypothetical protein